MTAAATSTQPCTQALLTARRLAQLAGQALSDELHLAPKPGLVDSRGPGVHRDMTLAMMRDAITALRPTFFELALHAYHAAATPQLRTQLGSIGRAGEQAMLQVTGGINTHRGAIWALGLLVAAAAQEPHSLAPHAITQRAAVLARLPDHRQPSQPLPGTLTCQRYGVGGARAEAQQGFPHIIEHALPALQATRARGHDEADARLDALLAIMAQLDDTCVLSRGGPDALAALQHGARAALAAGGAGHFDGRKQLLALDHTMRQFNASPGGAADLLAATLLLDRLDALASRG
ncbi:triphosphoribosyl-dephospho-CoA synthase [Vogesella sp. LIG4]|uniref:triphosphoribosyl-dephospho-CoA synthase n=1 Tax=Vogesella sp. LIG4 TaxID=1192162 RepID=UPI00081F9C09|nr:triphosphoribosyl-dephospho-CoA synthase [Vogesella sp. LIG4]SCK24439.1 triphosphoribosyl-dephospho-CoA synthase [Vogesella sp. LIG4]